MEMAFVYGDFKAFVEGITKSFKQLANGTHLHLSFVAPPEDCFLWFDADKMEKIFYNLLSNAFKYTPENGRVTVSLSCVADFRGKKAVQVQVSDTGKGIPKEHLPHVFERFYKVDDAASGSGIGLNLAKMLVELHDGSISVESEYGKGTCFTVVIPREEHGATADVALPEADVLHVDTKSERGEMWQQYATDNIIAADNQEVDAGMPLVLIVEDNADMRLSEKAHELGLLSQEQWKEFCVRRERVERTIERLGTVWVHPSKIVAEDLKQVLGYDMSKEASLRNLLLRPEVSLKTLGGLRRTDGNPLLDICDLTDRDIHQIEVEIKYSGYIGRQQEEISKAMANESLRIPEDFDYSLVNSLRKEAVQKLNQRKPANIGQASRISGVSPADISVLLGYMEQMRHGKG